MILGKLIALSASLPRGISLIKYGRLYNFPAASNANLAPTGWSVPSRDDLTTLVNYINTAYNVTPNDFGIGNHLKHRRQVSSPLGSPWSTTAHPRWGSNATHYGRDSVLFGGFPSGRRAAAGTFSDIGSYGYFAAYTDRYARRLDINTSSCTELSTLNKADGTSVKCMRNATSAEQLLADGTLLSQVEDIDGNIYDPVKIGTQIWFVQNLATTKLNNNTSITLITSGSGSTNGAQYSNYNNDTTNTFFSTENDSIWIPSLMIKP